METSADVELADHKVPLRAPHAVQMIDSSAFATLPIMGIDEAGAPRVLGQAPLAPRPDFLPTSGKRISDVRPECWTLSVFDWVNLVNHMTQTDTWRALVDAKGEYNISMYDVKDHFVVPWTRGTGCSISGLLGSEGPTQVMLSHAWAGSVIESYNCVQNMVNRAGVPKTARLFYCVFAMYQAEDACPGSLSISAQLALGPFQKIISSRPEHGIFVVHTTNYEVYSRMWTVHELDEGLEGSIQMRGLFDIYRWSLEKFDGSIEISTENSECRAEDRVMLEKLIVSRGGFARLDDRVKEFRTSMRNQLEADLGRTPEPAWLPEDHEWSQAVAVKAYHSEFDWIRTKQVTSFDIHHRCLMKCVFCWPCCPCKDKTITPRCPACVKVKPDLYWNFDSTWGGLESGLRPLGAASIPPMGTKLDGYREKSACVEAWCCNLLSVMCCFMTTWAPWLIICPALHHRCLLCWPLGPEPTVCCGDPTARTQVCVNCHNLVFQDLTLEDAIGVWPETTCQKCCVCVGFVNVVFVAVAALLIWALLLPDLWPDDF